MKKISLIFSIIFLAITNVLSQSPQQFKYQAVLRDGEGVIKANQKATIVIDILQGNTEGISVFSEIHDITTNAQGIVTLNIGSIADSLSQIDWTTNSYFIKVTVDGAEMGTSQMQWVPFALYAKNYGDVKNNMPQVFTQQAFNIITTAASCGGNIVMRGETVITERGICWGKAENPTTENNKASNNGGTGFYNSNLADLEPGATYYVRAFATNSFGTSYGNQVTFQTPVNVVFPSVSTAAAINITENSAAAGGNVTDPGGAEVIAKGICWSTNQNPTVADHKTNDGTGTGQFSSQMTNLKTGTTYYVRAYATNSAGTGYGSQVTLVTLKTIPVVSTRNVISITAMGGVSGGKITSDGGGTISEKGICWCNSENPTTDDNVINSGNGKDAYYSAINMLKPNTTCYVRAYAINEMGTAYGEQESFTTNDAFYDGFEAGFSGNTGGWGIVLGDAVEGAYSLKTKISGSETSLTRTLTNSGQIYFYIKLSNVKAFVTFYIDDVSQGVYTNTFWGLQSYPVSAGEHTFKWRYNVTGGSSNYDGWIDFIVMPK